MIGRVWRSGHLAAAMRQLYGKGHQRDRPHEGTHLLTGSAYATGVCEDVEHLEPVTRVDSTGRVRRDYRLLLSHLMMATYLNPGSLSDRSVWHCALRTAPTDRELAEDEWTDVAVDVMRRTGIWRWEWATQPYGTVDYDSDPGPQGCGWVAVRTNVDTAHLVAVLVTFQGLRLSPYLNFVRVRSACEAAEKKYGLARAGRTKKQPQLAAAPDSVGPA